MDPKTFAKLDPKLRETYQRVMGTAVMPQTTVDNPPPQPQSPPPPPATPTPTQNEAIPPEPTASPFIVAEKEASPSETKPKIVTSVHTSTPIALPLTPEVAGWKKILFITLGTLFFLGYTIFWLVFFKVKLPF